MAQSDQTIQNAAFPAVRADINDNLAAIYSQNSGASAPSTTVAFQPWVDTSSSPPVWKIRNANNSAWITVGVLDPTNFQVGGVAPIANGGTGQTTVAAAIAALLPSQTGNADKALVTDGASLLWSVITSSSFTKYTFAAGTGSGSTRTHTFTKPGSGTAAIVLLWGGGGAGGKHGSDGGGGGGGGACAVSFLKLSDLGSTETITLGQGGPGRSDNNSGVSGTNSTFGSHVTGHAGAGGSFGTSSFAASQGGNGGGVSGNDVGSGGGLGGKNNTSNNLSYINAKSSTFGGGGGGALGGSAGSVSSEQRKGGDSFFGGGGGGCAESSQSPPGGTSLLGGNGGAGNESGAGVNGSTPGGGGGASKGGGSSGSGGDGECWVLIF